MQYITLGLHEGSCRLPLFPHSRLITSTAEGEFDLAVGKFRATNHMIWPQKELVAPVLSFVFCFIKEFHGYLQVGFSFCQKDSNLRLFYLLAPTRSIAC